MGRKHALAITLAALSVAAPLPTLAGDFAGLYVGGYLAGTRSGGDYTAYTPRNGFAGFDVQGLDASGMGGGLLVGHNWDMGSYVLGIEASLTGFGARETSTRSNEEGTVPPFWREVDNQFALTPRVGVVAGNALIFAKAGVAWSKITAGHDVSGTPAEGSSTDTGWIVGVGAEMPLSDRLNGRIEFTHADFGSERYNLGSTGRWVNQDVRTNMLTLGFTYYFD